MDQIAQVEQDLRDKGFEWQFRAAMTGIATMEDVEGHAITLLHLADAQIADLEMRVEVINDKLQKAHSNAEV